MCNGSRLLTLGLVAVLGACESGAAPVPLKVGVSGVGYEGNTLLIAVPIENPGPDTASRVEISRITLGSAMRTAPDSVPIRVGLISGNGRAIAEASFAMNDIVADQTYLLTIDGTYYVRGRKEHLSSSQRVRGPVKAPGARELKHVDLVPTHERGARYPHVEVKIPSDVNEPGPPTPTGRRRGNLQPSISATKIESPSANGGNTGRRILYRANDLVFVVNAPLGATSSGVPDDPSGASGGLNGAKVVFATGNTYGSLSVDGGQTFATIDPTTVFPSRDASGKLLDGGLCCDQVVHYDALSNLFFWLMQFVPGSDGSNRLRLAVSTPEELVASGGTSWTSWDITSASVGFAGMQFDYPDLSVGDHFLYLSADISGGLMVLRVPLAQLKARSGISLQFTAPSDGVFAYGRHLIQNPADQLFWSGSVSTSSLRVFSMLESSNQYTWKDIDIDTYPFGNFVSNGPDGTNWLASVFSGGPGGVRLRTASADEIWFDWMAGSGGGFPQPHIQYVRLNRKTLDVISQSQIWNDVLAFSYASFTVVHDKVGAVLAYGSKSDYGSPAVGIMGDGVLYAPCTSGANAGRYGDYSTVRQAWPNGYLFSATVYCVNAKQAFDSRYVLFGRSADVNPIPISSSPLRTTPSVALHHNGQIRSEFRVSLSPESTSFSK